MNLVAQAAPDWTPLASFGLGGILSGFILWWMIVWARRMEAALNRVARANSLLVLSLRQAHDEAKRQAHEIIGEIDAAEKGKDAT